MTHPFSGSKLWFVRLVPLLWGALTCARAAAVDFTREVQPILAEHCFHCHGPDDQDRKGGLRLDVRESALKGGKSELTAIVPGKPDASEIILRIISTDEEEVMPPPKEKKPLTAAQKDVLRRWVAEGAPYAMHWAFVPPVKASLPAVEGTQAIPHPIDALVAAKLKSAGLTPQPAAEATTLCRRLYLDLIGLPPSPEEVAAFVADAKQGLAAAVDALTQKLLVDERYGERWARVWLDAARYADSNGFEKDLPREQWAWRDWVIAALNRDLPYDQFVIEQIAGDLLPGRTQDQVVATGFLRNGMVNEEGAIIPEQFRIEGLFDRMDCIGKATIGLTLQCAQCHTHKFDPISHDEYFGTLAFLNNTYEAQSWVYTPEQQTMIAKLRADLQDVDERSKKALPQWAQKLAAWEKELAGQRLAWTPLVATEMGSTSGLNHPIQLADRSVLTQGHPSTRGDIYIMGEPALAGVTGLRLEALCHDDLEFGGPGRSKYGTWAISELEVTAQKPGSDTWEKVAMKQATADFSEATRGLEPEWNAAFDKDHKRIVGPVAFLIDGNNDTAWRADRGPGRRNAPSVAVVQFEEPAQFPAGTKLKVLLRMHHSGDDNGRHNTMLGRCRVSLTQAPDPKVPSVDYGAILALETPAEKRTCAQDELIYRAWRAERPEAKKFNTEAETLWKKFPAAATSVLHLAERTGPLARETHLLERGSWDRPTKRVPPHVPAALHPLPADGPRDRLAFARWLADQRSPLTARVAVNRVWQAIFGTGIVETPEDFGTRTAVPEHQALLDWLAVDFMERGWSQKQLVRTIVTSRTYQQSSRSTAAQIERDPNNRLLSRGPRFRAEAEVVRDIALSVSGLLTHKVGGPSVFPPVPENILAYNYSKVTYWDVPEGPERYRRSLYLFRKRSMPDPMLSAFDAPNGDFSCARRVRSNTPLAALTSLNEPVFVEAAQALARRIWREGGATDETRTAYAYRLCTGRAPVKAEQEAVRDLLAATRERLKRGELKALDIAFAAFAKPSELPADATPMDLAAWTVAGRVLLNLDETLTKN
ncbi:PSD1 and planctomycete cytochrome C domain-containing protein [Horticoccus sp. 23ND18S-11]|uniref:PSD1 and planctomycete cytochrome C domain-containing protein n=1 Tax=Horticoccus sp. 23ND18S-11 TaxID=3391832 RepID=UPI0039C90C2A